MTDFAREPRTSHNGQGSHSRKTPSTPKARRIQPSMFIEVTAIVGNFATTDHLNPEAVAAYADGELSPLAMHRAKIHLVHCLECREEVERQRHASKRLKESNTAKVEMPSDLRQRLMGIAQSYPDGPCAEDIPRASESFIAKLDGIARGLRRINRGK